MTIALETIHQSSAGTKPAPGWFRENRSAIVRHGVINFFMLIILAPLVWVLMMSIKSRSDAMRSDFWPRRFDFTHYRYVFDKIDTFPINLLNSIYVTSGTVLITTVTRNVVPTISQKCCFNNSQLRPMQAPKSTA